MYYEKFHGCRIWADEGEGRRVKRALGRIRAAFLRRGGNAENEEKYAKER